MKRLALLFVLISVSGLYAQLTLENIWYSREFSPKFVAGLQNLNDGISYCKLEENEDKSRSCNRYEIKTGNLLSTLFSTDKILYQEKPIQIESYAFSEDETRVLISNGFESVYRHSGKSNVWVYELKTGKLHKITGKKIMYATMSPDGSKVAYVSDNNLFYYDITKKKDIQLTFDGLKNSVINGAVDWVYEEEFSMSRGFEWSPDGTYIAYYRFDESKVAQFGMDIYGSLYPLREVWKYPKAGEANSRVDVLIHKIGKSRPVLCATGSQNDQYLPRIKWMSPNYLSVQRLNRHQNKMEMLRFNYNFPKGEVIYTETNDKYIEVTDWYFVNPADSNFKNQAYFTSEKDGFNHIYALKKDGSVQQISKGNWDVDQFLGADEKKGVLYFTSGIDKPSERQLFRLKLDGSDRTQLTSGNVWHNVSFTETFEYFTDHYSSMTSPGISVIRDSEGLLVRELENNMALADKLRALNLGQVEFGSFQSTENVKLDYWKINPPDFDPGKKYPILFFVYGGPGHQTVKNQWQGANYLWYQYMAKQGYIIISVDNRGSGGRGEAFKKMTYLNLGKYETMDYIEAARYFGSQTYADPARIGIFGWSYGGFMASNCITLGADYFKTAVAVAPVTNWRYYDNIYTERYMRTPKENAAGYDDNSPINHVSKIKGNYLIIHGTADDNVHFQNAAEMVKAMNEQNIRYDAEFYPNTNHGIRGGKIRLHLFGKITDYLLKNL